MFTKRKALALLLVAVMILASVATTVSAMAAYTYSCTEDTAKAYEIVENVQYNQYNITSGENGHSEIANAITFSSEDYIPMVFSCFSGTSAVLSKQYAYATQKYGYEVVGVINGSFFSMDGDSTGRYGTLTSSIEVSNGKINTASSGTTEVVAFASDGTFQVVNSSVKYSLVIDGKPATLSYINRTGGTKANNWSTNFYYYDTSCGRVCDTDSCCPGYEIICKKIDNTELVIGGTLRGEVIEVKSNSYGAALADNYYDMSDKFVLFARASSSYASLAAGLEAGAIVEIGAAESIAESKEIMENASSVIANVGWLVKDGVDQTRLVSTIGTHSVTLCAQWTAFGRKADGSYVFYTTSGGSTGSNSGSVTLRDVAKAMIDLGCTDVIRMDGGGSVAMYVCDTGDGSDGYIKESTRAVGDCILIVKRPEASEDLTTALGNLIIEAEDALEKAPDDDLQALVDDAKKVSEAETSTDGDIRRVLMRLQASLSGSLELVKAMNKVTSLDESAYTEEELEKIWDLYKKAYAFKNRETANAVELDALAEELNAAVDINRNLAYGKSYTTSTVNSGYQDEGSKSLTDGKDATVATYTDIAWAGFLRTQVTKIVDTCHAYIDVDLGEEKEIDKFVTRLYDGCNDCGISAPDGVNYYISADGTNWTLAGTGTYDVAPNVTRCINSVTLKLETPVTARYFRADVYFDNSTRPWAFVSEVEAYAPFTGFTNEYGYVTGFNTTIGAGDASIFTPDVASDLSGMNLKWTRNIFLKYDHEIGGYVVTKSVQGGGSAVTDPLTDDCLVLAVHDAENHDSSTPNRTYAATAKVGDVIEFHGIFVDTKVALNGGYFKIVSKEDFDKNYNGKTVVADGIVAEYDAGYHTESGKIWNDMSGNGYDIKVGETTESKGFDDKAVAYKIYNSTVSFPTEIVDILNSGKFTVEMIIGESEPDIKNTGYGFATYLNSSNDEFSLFIRKNGLANYAEFKSTSNSRPKVDVGTGKEDFYANSTVAVTMDTETGKVALYVNGELIQEQKNATTKLAIEDLFFGHTNYKHNTEYKGFRIYDRALTAEEIAVNALADENNYASVQLSEDPPTEDFKVVVEIDDEIEVGENEITFKIEKMPELVSGNVTAIRVKMNIPEGVTIVKDKDGYVDFETTIEDVDDVVVANDGVLDITFMDFEFANKFEADDTITVKINVDESKAGNELAFDITSVAYTVDRAMLDFVESQHEDATTNVVESGEESSEAHIHDFSLEIKSEEYKATSGSCTEKTTYYKSCACGEHGTETFEGDYLPHTYDDDEDGECNICTFTRFTREVVGEIPVHTHKAVVAEAEQGIDISKVLADASDESGATKIEIEEMAVEFDPTAVAGLTGEVTLKLSTTTETEIEDAAIVIDISLEGATFSEGTATLTVPLPEEVPAGKEANVYYIPDVGEKVLLDSEVKGGKIVFTTTHFSTYAVLYEEPAEESSESSPTGDTGFVALGLVAAIALAGAAVVIKKRK